jgi:ATP-dependent protease ClpP protease subunit
MPAKNKQSKEKQPPILFEKTQGIIKQVNKLLGGTLVTYFNNPRGSVCHDDVLALYELLEKIGNQHKIYLFIKSSGGNGQASLRLVNLLRQHCEEVVAVIPWNVLPLQP